MDARARIRFFRRIAVAAFGLLILAVSSTFAAIWLIAQQFGAPGWMAGLTAVSGLLAAGTLLVMLFGAMRGFISPLRHVMEAADRVADGDYSVRVREHGPPPIRALAHSFNAMTERLQHADRLRLMQEERRHFVPFLAAVMDRDRGPRRELALLSRIPRSRD